MMPQDHDYRLLMTVMISWTAAQFVKVPINYLITRRWEWRLMFTTGGMPSSHAALVTSTALSIGLFTGFDTPSFAIAMALALVVMYDAAGVRRQAGFHAQQINLLVNELLSGHQVSEKRLKEVLGHSPLEVTAGMIFGIITSLIIWAIWS